MAFLIAFRHSRSEIRLICAQSAAVSAGTVIGSAGGSTGLARCARYA